MDNNVMDLDAEEILLNCADKIVEEDTEGNSDILIGHMILCSAAAHNRLIPSKSMNLTIRGFKGDLYTFFGVIPLLNASSVEYMQFAGLKME